MLVSRATLHNEDKSAIGTSESAIVWWSSAPGCHPEVVRAVLSERAPDSQPFVFPHVCPSCGQAASVWKEVAWRCVNVSCPAMIRQSLAHFVSRPDSISKGSASAGSNCLSLRTVKPRRSLYAQG
ncbi:MAG: hypothetical protein ACLSAH_06415 [Bilophila wadsworthia]